ncbi:hypothetical protein OC846_003058, partial [Tilletia horrida]
MASPRHSVTLERTGLLPQHDYHDPYHNNKNSSDPAQSSAYPSPNPFAETSMASSSSSYAMRSNLSPEPAEYPKRSFDYMESPYGQHPHSTAYAQPAPLLDDDDLEHSAYLPGADNHDFDEPNASRYSISSITSSRDRYIARKAAERNSYLPVGSGLATGAGIGGATALASSSSSASPGIVSKLASKFGLSSRHQNEKYGGYPDPDSPRGKRNIFWIVGGICGLFFLIAVIAIGVTAAKSHHQDLGSQTLSGDNSGSGGSKKPDLGDPSKFTLDSRLKQSFYGFCYTPLNSQYPQCGASLDDVIVDIQLLSQLTTRLRLYGADCNVTQLVLEAIKQTKVNMTVFPAVWVDTNATTYARQVSEIQDAITSYGTDQIEGVTVGNEYLLNGGLESDLIQKMADMRTLLGGMGLSKTLPVGTADAGSMISANVAAGADFIEANVHAWFGQVPIDQAAGWTWDYAMTNTPSVTITSPNAPKYYISEVGWPSGANATAFETNGPSVAGISQVNELLSNYVCQANLNASANAIGTNPGYF